MRNPTESRSLLRALALAAVCCRISLEESDDAPYADSTHQDLLAWLTEAHVEPELEPYEREAIFAPIGTLPERSVVQLGWRAEGLAILCWVLGRAPLPPYDEQASAVDLADAIGFFSSAIPDAVLRPKSDIESLSDAMEGIHTRLHVFLQTGEKWNKSAVALKGWFGQDYLDHVRVIDGDLALRGLSVNASPLAIVEECLSIARERRIALLWMLGQHRIYSQVTPDI